MDDTKRLKVVFLVECNEHLALIGADVLAILQAFNNCSGRDRVECSQNVPFRGIFFWGRAPDRSPLGRETPRPQTPLRLTYFVFCVKIGSVSVGFCKNPEKAE